MNRNATARTTTLLLAATLAAALTGCASGSDTSSAPVTTTSTAATPDVTTPSATTSAPATSSTEPTPTATPTPTPTPTVEGQLVEIAVANGKVTGPKGRVKVKVGDTVTLRVTSDVADEVHLHGYDKHVDVKQGGTADLTFKATLTGVFEVELEERALQLTQLQVQ